MLASRSVRPKLSLNISTATSQPMRPALSLKSPVVPLRSPITPTTPMSPTPISPTARNTRLNQRGYSTVQQPTYSYVNHSSSRSILKKGHSASSAARRQLKFIETPVVYSVSPIEDDDYYGAYAKISKDERRWQRR